MGQLAWSEGKEVWAGSSRRSCEVPRSSKFTGGHQNSEFSNKNLRLGKVARVMVTFPRQELLPCFKNVLLNFGPQSWRTKCSRPQQTLLVSMDSSHCTSEPMTWRVASLCKRTPSCVPAAPGGHGLGLGPNQGENVGCNLNAKANLYRCQVRHRTTGGDGGACA